MLKFLKGPGLLLVVLFLLSLGVFQNCEKKSLQGGIGANSSSSESSTEEPNAFLHIAVDNAALIYLNGQKLGAVFPETEDGKAGWVVINTFPLAAKQGVNTVAIMALNNGPRSSLAVEGPAALIAVVDLGNGQYILSTDSQEAEWKVSSFFQEGWSATDFEDSGLDSRGAALWVKPRAYGQNGDPQTVWGKGLQDQTGSALITGFPEAVANQPKYIWTSKNGHDADGNYVANGEVDTTVYFRLRFQFNE